MKGNSPVLSGIQSADIPSIWPFVEEWFEEELEKSGSEWTVEDIAHSLGSGEMQLWLATSPGRQIEAAMITRITDKGCSIAALVGDEPDRWIDLLRSVETWARAVNCKRLFFEGRKGWAKKLPDYRIKRVIMEKDLLNG